MTRILVPTPTRGTAPSHAPPDTRYTPGRGLARSLACTTLALGLFEVVAPRTAARCMGVQDAQLVQACGVREIITGVGVLSSVRPGSWMWARVAGDVVDLMLLLSAANGRQSKHDRSRQRAMISTAVVAAVTALDVVSASQLTTAARLEG